MARDPATVLAAAHERWMNNWNFHSGDRLDDLDRWDYCLAALDEAGYEVRPKTEDLHTTYKGRRFEVRLAIAPSGQPIASIYPVTDGDDPHTDHRGEPQGAPDP